MLEYWFSQKLLLKIIEFMIVVCPEKLLNPALKLFKILLLIMLKIPASFVIPALFALIVEFLNETDDETFEIAEIKNVYLFLNYLNTNYHQDFW